MSEFDDWDDIECTYEELAALFSCDKRTIIRYIDYEPLPNDDDDDDGNRNQQEGG